MPMTKEQRNCKYHKVPYQSLGLDVTLDDLDLSIVKDGEHFYLEVSGSETMPWEDDGYLEYEEYDWSSRAPIKYCPVCGYELDLGKNNKDSE